MRQITIDVPDELVSLWGSVEATARGARSALVLDALRRRRISSGRAAELLGISLWDLHDLMAEHGIPTVELDDEELRAELGGAETCPCPFGSRAMANTLVRPYGGGAV